jgi:diguanylate cyclase (GGDEF)-like protein/PAS domain S-box-containing protein
MLVGRQKMQEKRRENYFTEFDVTKLELISDTPEEATLQSRLISEHFVGILDALPFYVLLVDSTHSLYFANKAVRETFGLSLEEITGQFCPQLVHGMDSYPGCPVREAIRTNSYCEKEHFAEELGGRWLLAAAYPTGVKTEKGHDIYFHTVRDITDEKMTQKAVEDSESKFHTLFEEIQDVIFIMDPDGTLKDINTAGVELFGLSSKDEAVKLNLFNDLDLKNCKWDDFRIDLTGKGVANDHEIMFERPDGRMIIVSINANIENDDAGNAVIVRGIMRDLTRDRELEHKSTVDDLTNLYNHGFFQAYLLNKVRNLRSETSDNLTVLFIDIDDFKQYNDKFGHQAGDYVLGKVGEAIMRAARDEDIASRYGGEEFTLLLNCDFEMAVKAGERIRSTIEDLCSTFADASIKRNITVSVGLASLGKDADTAQQLVKVADARMYEAKRRGKNQVYSGEIEMYGKVAPDTD